jgi:hypothetical protein
MRDLSPRTHLAIILLPALLMLAGMATINWSVDPYGVWKERRVPGYNLHIPAAYKQDRFFKAAEPLRVAPTTLLVGTSRVGMGMDPADPLLGAGAYNLGLTGADMEECWRLWQHIESRHPQRLVILALDLFMFDAARPPWPSYADERLRVSADGWPRPLSWTWDLPSQLFSEDAVKDSLNTLAINRAPPPLIAAFHRGMFDERLFEIDIAAKGARQGFVGRRTDFLPKYLDWRWQHRRGGNRQLLAFRRFLDDAHARGRDLRLVINPEHAWLLELARAAGLGPAFTQWRNALVEANLAAATAAGRQPFPLFDAFGWTPVAMEAVPDPTVRTPGRWWWEASHYRKELGSRLLSAVIRNEEPADLGVFLRSTADVAARNADSERLRAAWLAGDADPQVQAETLVRELRRQRSGVVSREEMRRLQQELRRLQSQAAP